ncbi:MULTISPECIES: hypothetical protein [unclassified Actinomadura]|uniref:hypothetical protein n=1 Tax=unclassified Actinomadura TaxID=2626254 RepID=UPI0013589836|nr:hypothetical protein [Actinomadura sp. K4S16]
MTAGFVAGQVRARALARNVLGPGRGRALAQAGSLAEALAGLAATPYGKRLPAAPGLDAAQHAVAGSLLWHLRVLAGWLPPRAVAAMRAMAGWFEVANVDGLLQRLEDRPAEEPYALGALATAWPHLADAPDAGAVRERLAASPWGDPGSADPYDVRLFLRLSWASRVSGLGARAGAWAAGAAAVLVAGERFGDGRELPENASGRAARLLGRAALEAPTLPAMADRLGRNARRPLEGVDDAADLWRAEIRCWRRLERDGEAMLRSSAFGMEPVVGAVAVMAADVRRVRAALEAAALGGGSAEAYDEVA